MRSSYETVVFAPGVDGTVASGRRSRLLAFARLGIAFVAAMVSKDAIAARCLFHRKRPECCAAGVVGTDIGILGTRLWATGVELLLWTGSIEQCTLSYK